MEPLEKLYKLPLADWNISSQTTYGVYSVDDNVCMLASRTNAAQER